VLLESARCREVVDLGRQQGSPLFHDAKDRPIVATSRAAKKAWDVSVKLIDSGVTARLPMWSEKWNKGFANGSFAALLCPRWMLGIVQGNAGGNGEWDVAKEPGGAGTWGGSWLGVPAKSKHREQAVGLAMFLTTAQNDADASYANSMVPARADAVDALAGRTEANFNDAPAAQLMGEAAGQVTWADFGPHYVDLDGTFEAWLNSVETGDNSPAAAWSGALAAAVGFA
jgi:cellobiose transport system substrate-binding protein